MTSQEIRKTFLDFFQSKQHYIVPSAPMVIKNDPTLMFTNAGMNQFKDIFLGNSPAKYKRVADTQKCLRVSGKHNDLEEVGIDTYHHTMFEMLGNWSFGDYFKKEAIEWAWELLTDVYKIDKNRLYVTVFEGDKKEKLAFDEEAYNFWKQWIAEDRILKGNKKDNFWEMGDTGPCGPCSEIHIDLRSDDERKKEDGKTLVNTGHPQVIEIWNNVFMEFNRKADGSLEPLPAKHVDTGMGFERLCMALQGKKSNYDTDIFQPLIQHIAKLSGKKYGQDEKTDVAMRVMADHIRAISFAIADGQLPSNNKAGYVIRRILRRAVRYYYTFLDFKEPFLNELVPLLAQQFDGVFPELKSQQDFIKKVIHEEEVSFLRTLGTGIDLFNEYASKYNDVVERKKSVSIQNKVITGQFAFKLYDTYGFPIDLTRLMAQEIGWYLEENVFYDEMNKQQVRSRNAATVDTEDWIVLQNIDKAEFVGYDNTQAEVEIIKYRKVKSKEKEQYQLVFNRTPFYAESGGQVGDTGILYSSDDSKSSDECIITDTQKENNLIIHFTDKLPKDISKTFLAKVDKQNRKLTENNHSVTHLLHAALRQVLGKHVQQKGSLVNEDYTRFDFSHFTKVTDEELKKIEDIVNTRIRENIPLNEQRNIPIEEAKKMGAMALFGEKYGDFVRVITFDKNFSVELCGGTHVPATGQIGLFKIVSESAVAAGVRRIEAITADKAQEYIDNEIKKLNEVRTLLKNPKDVVKGLQDLMDENVDLNQKINLLLNDKVKFIKAELILKIQKANGLNFIAEKIDLPSSEAIKNLCFELKGQIENLFLVLGAEVEGKPNLSVMLSENLVKEKNLNASNIVRELAKEIQGGGGGQPFYATAGGKDASGIQKALDKAKTFLQ